MTALDDDSRPRLAPKARLRPDSKTGKLALLSPEHVLLLNATGAAILQLCDGRTIAEISAVLAERFQAPPATLRADVLKLLSRLRARGFIVAGEDATP